MLSTLPEPLEETLVVLGAGATRGTTLARDQGRPLPPVDADFFTQIQRIKHDKHQAYINALLEFCHAEFGPGWTLTMERFFNHVWYAQRFRSHGVSVKVKDGLGAGRDVAVTTLFRQVLLASLEQSLFGDHSLSCLSSTCELHDVLAQYIEPDDGIISFNYDCLIDASLRRHCPYWDVESSYGFTPLATKAQDYWRRSARSRGTVRLYKLHGSINWQLARDGAIRLVQRPYTRQNGDRDFFIVPPVLSKDDVTGKALWPIWKKSFKRVVRARSIFIAGYSLPAADAIAHALFTSRGAAPRASALKYLILANPDRATRHHLSHSFRASIGPQTRVLVFDRLSDSLAFLLTGSRPLA